MCKKILSLFIALSIFSISYSQKKDSIPKIPDSTSKKDTITLGKIKKVEKPNSIKPYKEIIPDSAYSKIGLFTIHKVEDDWFFEIPDSLLNRDILVVTRYDAVPGGAGVYAGEIVNQQMVQFVKGPNKNVFLKLIMTISMADSTNAIYKAVVNSNINPYIASFPIKAFGNHSTVIEVGSLFVGDNPALSFRSSTRKALNLGGVLSDRSFIKSIHTYPINTEIKTVKTYMAIPPMPGNSRSQNFDVANDAGVVTIGFNHSFLLLPKKTMPQRQFDNRVGYFADGYTQYSDNQQRVKSDNFIVRWNLQPKPEDFQKWAKGELVEPAKQIVYYIDPATPVKWRPYLIAGVEDWNKAFESAGFKNAIVAKNWPVNDTTMSMEDARYSVIRYFASDIENAYGPNVHDPRSGEIIESHIGWYHNVMKLVHDWYMIQAGPIDPRARKMTFDDALMGDLIRFVSSHEIGHTLGLRHNFGSSSTIPVELLRNKKWVEANGHTPSIMDYARFNYVAQPEDHISSKGIYPRIGVYDKWAIKWGYSYTGATNIIDDHKITNKWIIDNLSKDPRLWFGTESDPYDPRSQSEDLGNDAMLASHYGILNLKRVIIALPQWTKEEADPYDNLSEMYLQAFGQYSRYIGHVLKNIGGIYSTPKSIEQSGSVYVPTPKQTQIRALTFLNTELFKSPNWLLDTAILNKISSPSTTGLISRIQNSAITALLSQDRLNRLLVCSSRYGEENTFQVEDLMDTLETDFFEAISQNTVISENYRNLQKMYVDALIRGLSPSNTNGNLTLQTMLGGDLPETDIPSILRGHLLNLAEKIKRGIEIQTNNISKYHLMDLNYRITKALATN